jgi:formylmethanofuran dehydrogenase subunit B
MTAIKSFLRENSGLAYFLIAQFIAAGALAASALAYAVQLENRVHTMETRGAQYTVARMDDMKLAIAKLEQSIEKNEQSIERIKDVLLKNGLRP